MLNNNFKINLEMLSDWQVGTGAGIPGGIDELISKDVDGFLQVPAKSLVGIWRDALERLTLGLDNGIEKGNWSKWVEVIFGNQPNVDKIPHYKPVPAILSLQPARISENLRAKIGGDKRLKQALTFTKVGVKIDELSGTSETDALRFEEMGRIGTVLEANVELDWNYFTEEQQEIALSLLVLSAKLVERIGGKRRRGAGKCCFKVLCNNVEKTVIDAKTKIETTERLNKIRIKEEKEIEFPKKPTDAIENKAKIEESDRKDVWQTCEYTLTLETPVSIVTAVLGNVSETLDFIPGTYLINHFVKQFGQAIFTAIQANNFQISPATICIDGNRSFPVPKVFAKEKMKQAGAEKEEVYNRLLETLEGKKQTKPIREGYISDINSSTVSHATTPQTILMHNAVDDEVQRPTTDVVGVYSREAIKAGTILKGKIRFKNLQFDYKDLNEKDGKVKKVRIGTSKKDGGLAKIEVTETTPFTAQSVVNANNNKLIVYLASDVMLRNGNLRQTNLVEGLKDELEKTFGKGTLKSYDKLLAEAKAKLETNPNDKDAEDYIEKRKDFINSIVHVRRIESWQTRWGFPRPTLTLMQAGSVVVFETNKTVDIAKLETEGIGERRGEGYGQVIFNPQVLSKKGVLETTDSNDLKLEWKKADATKAPNLIGNGVIKDTEFAKIIEETAWREEIKLAVSKIAADKTERERIFGFGNLNMSQIGGLRSVIMRLQSKKPEERKQTSAIVTNWLTHLEHTPNRLKNWGDERIEKVRCVLKDDNVWEKLKPHFHYPKSLELEHNLKDELWAEAVKSLFYACQHAHKRDTEDK
jgi:CRISPR-associated protein Csx10